jgi:competence ComEA-like helix-hairpin-helix protein
MINFEMKLGIFVLVLFFVSFISASCEEGQIDINEASLSELEMFNGIGPVKAQAIIDTRPFNSVEDLIEVYGIGEATLNNILGQGLACVGGEIIDAEVVEDIGEIEIKETSNGNVNSDEEDEEFEMITLTTQTIKSTDNKENKSNYALFGFAGFCLLLGILFLVKKRKYKNEFR